MMITKMKIFPITLKRYFNFAKSKIINLRLELISFPQRNTPFSDYRTREPCCVIGNGIPKSGTYLINRILKVLNRWEDIRYVINETHYDLIEDCAVLTTRECLMDYAVTKLREGQFVSGHLPWSKRLEKKMAKRWWFLKHIFIYRDPRDTFVSYMRYVTYSPTYKLLNEGAREYQRFMRSLPSDDERLTHAIKSRKDHYARYRGWLDNPYCFSVKFESLYQDIQRLKDGVWGETLKALFKYLGPYLPADPIKFYQDVYGIGMTATDVKNKIGQYKTAFKKQHYALLDTPDFKKILEDFGYDV